MKVVLIDPVSSGGCLAQALRERGVEPVRVYQPELRAAYDADHAPGHTLLHESFEATCTALRRYGAQAVLPGSEFGVILADELAAALALPHNALEVAPARRDKVLMAQALEAAGVPVARTEAVCDEEGLQAALGRFTTFPVVVKPAASAGSDGLAVCTTPDDVRAAFHTLLGHANLMGIRNEVVVIQEYLAGPHYIVDTVSSGGVHALTDVLVVRFDEVDGKPVQRHKTLRRTLDAQDREVVRYAQRCLEALRVTDGAAHTEIRLTDRGPLLVEVNSRLMGPVLPVDAWVSAVGHSQATVLADAVLDPAAFKEFAARGYAPAKELGFVFLRAGAAGSVRSMPGLAAIRRLPTFHSLAKIPALGTEIKDPLLTTGTAGLAYFVGPDPDAIAADIARVHAIEDNGELYEIGAPASTRHC